MSGDAVWVAVDGVTQATPLGNAALGLDYGVDMMSAFIGYMPGTIGGESILAIGIAAMVLIATRIASWRVMLGCVIGLVATVGLFNLIDSSNPMFAMNPLWHILLGGFAFGAVFMATDPVSASHTDTGRLIYGILIGFMCALIRVVNPAFPEGMMLAILFGNLFAPLIDNYVVQSNIKRRLARG
jgi:Na+-transporting NADH:ubiquinone oxidoreductase subunit B